MRWSLVWKSIAIATVCQSLPWALANGKSRILSLAIRYKSKVAFCASVETRAFLSIRHPQLLPQRKINRDCAEAFLNHRTVRFQNEGVGGTRQ